MADDKKVDRGELGDELAKIFRPVVEEIESIDGRVKSLEGQRLVLDTDGLEEEVVGLLSNRIHPADRGAAPKPKTVPLKSRDRETFFTRKNALIAGIIAALLLALAAVILAALAFNRAPPVRTSQLPAYPPAPTSAPEPAPVAPAPIPQPVSTAPQGPTCTPGEPVHYSASTFTAEFLVVDNGAPVLQAIGGKKDVKSYWAPLWSGVRENRIPLHEGGELVLHIRNINPAQMPAQVPHLHGKGICAGMVAVRRVSGGVDIAFPNSMGQESIVLPLAPLAASRAPLLGVTASFSLAYAPALTAGSHKGQKNTLWDSGKHVGRLIAAGKRAGGFSLISQGKDI